MNSIKHKIIKRISTQKDWVFSACDFNDIADQTVINDALARLSVLGKIQRLDKGLYHKQIWSKFLSKYAPASPDQIIKALARKNNYPLLIDGLYAANSLGLTNAVPTKNVYFSDVNPTKFQIGGWDFTFRKAGKKRLYWAGRKGALAMQALWWLGKDIIKQDKNKIVKQLKDILPGYVKNDLLQGLKLKMAPSWMSDVIHDITQTS